MSKASGYPNIQGEKVIKEEIVLDLREIIIIIILSNLVIFSNLIPIPRQLVAVGVFFYL
jgi:hypothetical protein